MLTHTAFTHSHTHTEEYHTCRAPQRVCCWPCCTWYLLQALFGCLAVDQLSLGGAEAGVRWGHHGAVVFWERPEGNREYIYKTQHLRRRAEISRPQTLLSFQKESFFTGSGESFSGVTFIHSLSDNATKFHTFDEGPSLKTSTGHFHSATLRQQEVTVAILWLATLSRLTRSTSNLVSEMLRLQWCNTAKLLSFRGTPLLWQPLFAMKNEAVFDRVEMLANESYLAHALKVLTLVIWYGSCACLVAVTQWVEQVVI